MRPEIEETVLGAMLEAIRNFTTETVVAARDTAKEMLDSGRFKNPEMLRRVLALCDAELARRLYPEGEQGGTDER